MSATNSESLRREIAAALPKRPFALRFWDGAELPATAMAPAASGTSRPTITLRSPAAIAHMLRAPGDLGLGRAWVTGELDSDDLDGAIALMGRWHPPAISRRQKLRLLSAAVRTAGFRLPQPPAAELRPRGRHHSRRRDASAVRHHYDVSNEFFALFLDETMTYSCALFEDGVDTLEDAQRAKLDLVCRKLELRPGMRLLDIGCGWGSLVIHAAREYGVEALGVTLSENQAALAAERAREAGVGDAVEIRVMDYRELGGRRFDAVASVGMVEHVGEAQIDEYARRIASALAPGGRVLNHGITRVEPQPRASWRAHGFLQRYVFPDTELLNLSRMVRAFELAGLETLHVENLHTDYAETLRHWAERLDRNLAEAERAAGTERVRVWQLFLRAGRNAFEIGNNAVCQILCSAPITEPSSARPTARRRPSGRRRVRDGRVSADV